MLRWRSCSSSHQRSHSQNTGQSNADPSMEGVGISLCSRQICWPSSTSAPSRKRAEFSEDDPARAKKYGVSLLNINIGEVARQNSLPVALSCRLSRGYSSSNTAIMAAQQSVGSYSNPLKKFKYATYSPIPRLLAMNLTCSNVDSFFWVNRAVNQPFISRAPIRLPSHLRSPKTNV